MPRLQQLILRLGCATLSEVNRAIFAYPDLGLVDALAATLGEERARHIHESVAASLKLPLVDDTDVRIDDSVLQVSALQLTPLVSRYKALPLRREMDGNTPMLVLAMANPLNVEARSAFSRLYGLPIKACMAREKAIMTAFALASTKLSHVARSEVRDRSDHHQPGTMRLLEDPEVWKALQQLVATAVKHHANEVIIAIAGQPLRGEFRFADGHSSRVEVPVDSLAVLAAFLRRGQVSVREGRKLLAHCRLRFKSVAVTFEIAFQPDGDIATGDAARGTAVLRSFQIDGPDNPCFWLGMSEPSRDSIHRMLGEGSGVLVIASPRQPVREFVLKSIGESYVDAEIVDGVTDICSESILFESAKARRIFIGLDVVDEFAMCDQIFRLSRSQFATLNGAVAYQQIGRLCELCSQPATLSQDQREALGVVPGVGEEHYMAAGGCPACSRSGVIGFWGLTSVLELNPATVDALQSRKSGVERKQFLAEAGFCSLFEDAVATARRGLVSASQVMEHVSAPPEDFIKSKLRKSLSSGTRDLKALHSMSIVPTVSEDDVGPPLPAVVWESDGAPVKTGESEDEPIRGRSVFMAAPKEEVVRASADPANGSGTHRQVSTKGEPPLVLVIDDDPDQRSILRRVFEMAGYRVEVAADGIDGIVTAVRHSPSVIVVDFMMPELDGRETVRRLKSGSGTAAIPIVALTAYADPDIEFGLLQAGADDFCAKSVSKQVLLKRVERLLNK